MAHQVPRSLLTVLGFLKWGDIGPLTLYKNKQGKLVAFAKTWPTKPASPAQQILRDLFRAAALAWNDLHPDVRAQWELATKRASLCMHGYDLWVSHFVKPDLPAIQTLEHQTNTTLL